MKNYHENGGFYLNNYSRPPFWIQNGEFSKLWIDDSKGNKKLGQVSRVKFLSEA